MGLNVALQKAGQLNGEYDIYTRHSAELEVKTTLTADKCFHNLRHCT
jgi:hypothetical protein